MHRHCNSRGAYFFCYLPQHHRGLRSKQRSIERIVQRLVALDTHTYLEVAETKTTTSIKFASTSQNETRFPFRKRNTPNFLCVPCTGTVRSQSRHAKKLCPLLDRSLSLHKPVLPDYPSLLSHFTTSGAATFASIEHILVQRHQIQSVIRRRRRYTRDATPNWPSLSRSLQETGALRYGYP